MIKVPGGQRCTGHRVSKVLCTSHYRMSAWVAAFEGGWCPQCQQEIEEADVGAAPQQEAEPEDRAPENVATVRNTRAVERLTRAVQELTDQIRFGFGQQEAPEPAVQLTGQRCYWCDQPGHSMPDCTNYPSPHGAVGQRAQPYQQSMPGWKAYQQHQAKKRAVQATVQNAAVQNAAAQRAAPPPERRPTRSELRSRSPRRDSRRR